MKKICISICAVLLVCSCSAIKETDQGLNKLDSSYSNARDYEPSDFRFFLYFFFNDHDFQINHIRFPLSHEWTDPEFNLFKEQITKDKWVHQSGPDHYRCELDCYDIMIYDNFEKNFNKTSKRVFALEGVENGINESLYFELIEGKWTLVKWESFSN